MTDTYTHFLRSECSVSDYIIATLPSPSYQFAVHGSDVGNNGVTDTRVRIKTNTQIYM